MYCSKCGIQNDDASRFCPSCGSSLRAPIDDPNMAPPSIAVPGYALAYVPKQKKLYRVEFTLGLIGAIIGSVIFFILALMSITELLGELTSPTFYNYYADGLVTITAVFCLASFVLGYVGIAQINKQNLSGGIPLLFGAFLAILSMFLTPFGILTLFYWPLLLSGGITALARRSHLERTASDHK